MVTRINPQSRENWQYLLFLGALLVFIAYTYSLTTEFRVPETGILPRLVVIGMLVVILVDLAMTLFPQLLPGRLQTDSSTTNSFGDRDIGAVDFAKQFGWVILYLAGIYYVGFFTSSFVFALLYVFVNGPESSPKRRAAIGVAWAVSINIFLYVLFVELLQVGSIFQFGILP